jgi:MFS family permease
MNQKTFNLWHRISAIAALVISAVTYLLTIEPSASFWDCGEFIASSYKLEVGHPPGNPVFQLIARVFTMFGDNMHAAVLVNAMSALCSAFTIFFLYLTIVWLAKRLVKKEEDGSWSVASAIAVIGSGLVGSLAYCFSDTFWFSAVEGEVYAMSSLFTAAVFWLMTMWYDRADEPHSLRWIVLIAFLMGLSIGVHLLNLLAIPALVFMFYYRQREEGKFTFWELVKIFLVGVVILGVINFILIPYLPKLAAYVDLFFVNTLGLPYNTGAAFFMIALLALCFWGLFTTLKKGKVFWNTALLCLTTIVVGFSLFSIVIIRSSVKTPTNEYQPDNPFTLVRYLSREQYGSTPLIYGQYFDAPYDLEAGTYWAPLDGKYKKAPSPVDAKYKASGKMLFPRMWSSDSHAIAFYQSYMNGKGKRVAGADHKKPTMGANLAFFFDYQMNWMYWRYFMWNFAGRQNDIHGQTPDDLFFGNWESGIRPLDELRLGDQHLAPSTLRNNKAKNHYYLLPLLLGLLGLFFQFARDKRGCWLVFLLFFMTGIAVVLYLNQPPYQVRERDYAYAGSFYAFSIWIGLGVAALAGWVTEGMKKKESIAVTAAMTLACLGVPALMAAENWDDHDRSNRYTAVEMARNYLNSVGPNGILITHGDNDTFPLWYAQEVEEVRPDVRICNTSLLGTDWHIDQMTWAVNQSAPLDLKVPHDMYLYGTNEYVYINDQKGQPVLLKDVMDVFRHPDIKMAVGSRKVDYIMSRKLVIPVNKENALKSGIVPEKFADDIADAIVLQIPESKSYLTKPEIFMLDLLSNYQWDRPIHMLNQGGDLDIGLKEYLMYDGFSTHLVPFRNKIGSIQPGKVDSERLYHLMMDVYSWDALKRQDYFVDYQNLITHLGVLCQRGIFLQAANACIMEGKKEPALELLDKCQECIPSSTYPLESLCLGFTANDYMVIELVDSYLLLGEVEKGITLAAELADQLLTTTRFYKQYYPYEKTNLESATNYVYFLISTLKDNGQTLFAAKVEDNLKQILAGKIILDEEKKIDLPEDLAPLLDSVL